MTDYEQWLKTQKQGIDKVRDIVPPKRRKCKRKSNGKTLFVSRDAKRKRAIYDRQQGRCAFCDVQDTIRNRPLLFSQIVKMYLCDTCVARIRDASTGWIDRMRKILDILSENT